MEEKIGVGNLSVFLDDKAALLLFGGFNVLHINTDDEINYIGMFEIPYFSDKKLINGKRVKDIFEFTERFTVRDNIHTAIMVLGENGEIIAVTLTTIF